MNRVIAFIPNDTKIMTGDEIGHGGAYHDYQIVHTNAEPTHDNAHRDAVIGEIKFQNGTVPEAGVNGITNESLLLIVSHRLRCFQAGPFACEENAQALMKISEAINWLESRTANRVERGVEGTHVK